MEKVEEDLARSKNLREKQAKEFSRQLDDLKIKHEKEVSWIFRSLYLRNVIPALALEKAQELSLPCRHNFKNNCLFVCLYSVAVMLGYDSAFL